MAKAITITVKGTDEGGSDAPTVEDLLAQIQDLIGVLKGVEEAVAEDGKRELVWKVTNVTRNSPLRFEITPFPKTYAMNIDQRAARVVETTALGLQRLASGGKRPEYFTDEIVARAEKVYERVTNGLAATAVDFSNYRDAPPVEITKETVRAAIATIHTFRAPSPVPHRELGSVEGIISRVELDGHQRPVVWLRARLDGSAVKCVATDGALDRIGHYQVAQILRGMRVTMFGVVNYKDVEEISSIDVDGIHVFANDIDLPGFEEILSPNFTRGLEASEYLEALRQDG